MSDMPKRVWCYRHDNGAFVLTLWSSTHEDLGTEYIRLDEHRRLLHEKNLEIQLLTDELARKEKAESDDLWDRSPDRMGS